MQKLLASSALAALLLAGSLAVSTPASAQSASVAAACTTQQLPIGYLAGTLVVTQQGDLCVSGGGGGGGSASYTAAAAPFSVSAGVNKPAGIDTANSAQFFEPVKPGTTTTIDLSGGTAGSPAGSVSTVQGQASMTPVAVSANGGVTTPLITATASVPITFTAAGGPTQIIAASGSTKIYITHWDVVLSGAGTFALVTGTGTNCGTGTTYLTGAASHPMAFAANGGISAGGGLGPVLITGAGGEVCAITTGAVDSSGSIAYAQF